VAVALLLAARAGAQTASPRHDPDRFQPAPGDHDLLTLFSARTRDPGTGKASVLFSHSSLLLRGVPTPDAGTTTLGKSRASLHWLATVGLLARLELGAHLHVLLDQSPMQRDRSYEAFAAGDLANASWQRGDLRLIPKLTLLDNPRGGLGLAVVGSALLPTGADAAYASAGTSTNEYRAVLDYRRGKALAVVNVGYAHAGRKTRVENVVLGRELRYGAGVAVPLLEDSVALLGEVHGALARVASGTPFSRAAAPLELDLLVRTRSSLGITVDVGGGVALIEGVGVPAYRILGKIGYAPGITQPARRQHDEPPPPPPPPPPPQPPPGAADRSEKPPPGPRVEEAPEGQDDEDDEVAVAEVSDHDRDGVPDGQDRCPHTPDGGKVGADGCPRKLPPVRLEPAGIVVEGRLDFREGTAQLVAESLPLVRQLADLLRASPELELLEIRCHTAAEGSRAASVRLSQERADTLRTHLIARGVAAARLRSKGYGPSLPVADNDTPAGRDANRRVEIIVLRRPRPRPMQ
jgi:outer membrane protein OmpA-like peptidoglycan-associated protein